MYCQAGGVTRWGSRRNSSVYVEALRERMHALVRGIKACQARGRVGLQLSTIGYH